MATITDVGEEYEDHVQLGHKHRVVECKSQAGVDDEKGCVQALEIESVEKRRPTESTKSVTHRPNGANQRQVCVIVNVLFPESFVVTGDQKPEVGAYVRGYGPHIMQTKRTQNILTVTASLTLGHSFKLMFTGGATTTSATFFFSFFLPCSSPCEFS